MEYDITLGVPCSDIKLVSELPCTREDEAVGIAVGAWLSGKKPLVFMQNSGLGNCVDIITSLLNPYRIHIDMLIANRCKPEHHEFMGKITRDLLRLMEYEATVCD